MIISLEAVIDKMERSNRYVWKLYMYKDYRSKDMFEMFLEGTKENKDESINALRTAVDSVEEPDNIRWCVELLSSKNSNGETVYRFDMTKTGKYVAFSSVQSSKGEPKETANTTTMAGLGMLGQLEMSRLNNMQEDIRNEKSILLQREMEINNKVENLHNDRLIFASEKATFEAEKKAFEQMKQEKEAWWKEEDKRFRSKTERMSEAGDLVLGKIVKNMGLIEGEKNTLSGLVGDEATAEEFTPEEKLIASIADNIASKNLTTDEIKEVGISVENQCKKIIKNRKPNE